MQITIEVPEMKCAKCNAAAAIQPHLLSFKGAVPAQFREAFSAVMKERPDVTASDDSGGSWSVMADNKPTGWVKGPSSSDLCAKCGVLWQEAGKAFLAPPADLPEALEAEPLPPSPATAPPEKEATRPMTMSEIIAAKNYENNKPTTNSMMPMVMPSSLRR